MDSQCFLMDLSTPGTKSRALYYEEKAVGSTSFYKCEACPYMALAEDDIKFHLFTVHPELAKSNGLGNDINIQCPGCSDVFDAENTLRTHLREHHKMGIRDVRKMVKSLIQIALRSTKKACDNPVVQVVPRVEPVKMPQVIEIVSDPVQNSSALLPGGVTVISVDELQKMSTPNFEKVDPKEIIQEASINIVYSGELTSDYVTSPVVSSTVSTLQNLSPDTPSSSDIVNAHTVSSSRDLDTTTPNVIQPNRKGRPFAARTCGITCYENKSAEINKTFGKQCTVGNCGVRMVSEENHAYHISCHQNGKLQCPECKTFFFYVKPLHTHLWKAHGKDMELNSCNKCDYKTYSLNRLNSIHKMTHEKVKKFPCLECGKPFKSPHQLTVHKLLHKKKAPACCSVCMKELGSQRELKRHIAAVHEKRKPFQCSECDYKAATKPLLELHIRNHTGKKPYRCSECSYRSADHNALRRHKIKHSNLPLYTCKHCPYNSAQSRCFKNHMSSEHPNVLSEEIYPCPYCPFKALSRDKFINHLCSHDDEGVKHILSELQKNQPQKNRNKFNEGISKANWNTPTDSPPKPNWNSPVGTQSQPNWNTTSDIQPNWNTSGENHPKTNWNTPNNNKTQTNWNSPAGCQSDTNWNTPSESQSVSNWKMSSVDKCAEQTVDTDEIKVHSCDKQNISSSVQTPSNINIPIEVDDCDSEHDVKNKSYPANFNYIKVAGDISNDHAYHLQEILTDLTMDDNNSDCNISENSDDPVNDRIKCYSKHPLPNVSYGVSNMHSDSIHYLKATVTMGGGLMQNSNSNVMTSDNSFASNNVRTNILSNYPIHLPPNPRLSIRRNLTLTPLDKIPLPVPKVGPIITPNQILPVPPSSNSPVSHTMQQHNPAPEDGVPRKKAKISVKSNLILKGPDQINMFQAEQNMAFARLQDNEGLNLSSPVTFNNLITTQFMQLPPEPVLTNNPENILQYAPDSMLGDQAVSQTKDNRPLFTFNREIDLNSINLLSQQVEHNKMSIICGNASFIKLESKQNIQSPSLERMCSANSLIKGQEIPDDYCKASPLLEDIQKNVNDIKNEIKSDTYFNMAMTSQSSPSVMDQHLLDTIIGANELYGHLDLSGVVLPEMTDDQQPDIIEIDDNSEDNKLIPPRFDLNFPLEYVHNDFYFMEGDCSQPCNASKTDMTESESELQQTEVPLVNQSIENTGNVTVIQGNDFEKFIHGKKDPMMNTVVRPVANKINVKNIELMKN